MYSNRIVTSQIKQFAITLLPDVDSLKLTNSTLIIKVSYRIVAYLLQVIVSKFEGQGVKIIQLYKRYCQGVKHAP